MVESQYGGAVVGPGARCLIMGRVRVKVRVRVRVRVSRAGRS